MLLKSLPLPLLLLSTPLALAANRVFTTIGTSTCQACLSTVESACDGPVTSLQFNKCFCSAASSSKSWAALAGCLSASSNSGCGEDQHQILSAYGAHCFSFYDGEEQEICVKESQEDQLKLSLADSFCTEFVSATTSITQSTTSATNPASSTDTSSITKSSTSKAESTNSASVKPTTEAPSTAQTAPAATPSKSTESSTGAKPSASSKNAGIAIRPIDFSGAALFLVLVSGIVQML